MSNETLNDSAWEKLFVKYEILKRIEIDGSFKISADQIKEFREPRLMAKFDHSINLPKIFAQNDLAILPVTRGDYVISRFNAYHKFEESNSPVINFSLPSRIQSLDSKNITSEAIALNCAAASGIIADFMEVDTIFPSVSGRMGSGKFSFTIKDSKSGLTHKIDVNNSQIEIDAGYEGDISLALIEAKIDLSDDFLIRQLYYPFRTFQGRVTKTIRPIFFVYSNGIYRLYEYAFEDANNYNSLQLIKQRNYAIEDTHISREDIIEILERAIIVDEPHIPFPQADKFWRVINLCELLNANNLSKADVTENYAFTSRQTNYYTDAARYLGLIDKCTENEQIIYTITNKGRKILSLNFKQRQLAYCESILSHGAFNESLRLYFQKNAMPSTNELVNIMLQSQLFNVESDETFRRRAKTIKGWINWIISLIT